MEREKGSFKNCSQVRRKKVVGALATSSREKNPLSQFGKKTAKILLNPSDSRGKPTPNLHEYMETKQTQPDRLDGGPGVPRATLREHRGQTQFRGSRSQRKSGQKSKLRRAGLHGAKSSEEENNRPKRGTGGSTTLKSKR